MNIEEGSASTAKGSARLGSGSSLSDQVQLVLKGMIEAGQVRAGERLSEAQVSKSFGVSRSPARKALDGLRQDGLIENAGARGFRIAGRAAEQDDGRLATLDNVRLANPRQWERMYAEVEKEINVQVLFASVRINENELANQYGVSRTVTRDVLARMHSVGLVAKGRGGRWVAERISAGRIRNLFEIRSILEPAALQRAYPHISREELIAVQHQIDRLSGWPVIEGAEFDRAEMDLHVQLLSHCPNKEILLALNRTHLLFAPTRHLSDPFLGAPMRLLHGALNEHTKVVQSLIAGDPARACEYLIDHIKVAHDRWIQRLKIAAHLANFRLPPYLTPLHQ